MLRNLGEAAHLVELTAAKKSILKDTTITNDEPGPIVADFQTLLTFVQETNPQLTGRQMLPLRPLADLNERMTHPLQHDLRRPQQKSFPHINGLFMLLRATGLTVVGSNGKKPILTVDESQYNSWLQLSPVERYFMLLETWLLRATPEAIGERASGFFSSPFTNWMMFFMRMPSEGHHSGSMENLADEFRYSPELYSLALMELFGLVTIQHGPAVTSQGWQINGVTRTEWGDALLSLLHKPMTDMENLFRLDSPEQIPMGELMPVISPYFPDWQNNLELKQGQFRPGLYTFKVMLWKGLWRRIAIPASSTLEDLSRSILRAYGFGGDHLHEFVYTNRRGAQESVHHPYMNEPPWTTDVLIGDIPLAVGGTMLYHYGFGASWRFDVALETIAPENDAIKEPTIVEEKGEAPEEYPSYDDDWE